MKSTKQIQLSLLSVEMSGAMIGNILLLFFILRSRQLHRKASLNYISSCAVADITSAMITIPFAMDHFVLQTGNLLGSVPAIAHMFCQTFSGILTLTAMLFVLIDRILIVKYPVKYINKMTVRRARRAIFIMWVSVFFFSVVLTIIAAVLFTPRPTEDGISYLKRFYQAEGTVSVSIPPVFISSVVFVPSIVLYREIQKTRHATENIGSATGDRAISASCQTVLIVMAVYLVSYLPAQILNILSTVSIAVALEVQEQREFYAILLLQLSSLVNPFVLIARSSTIRESAARILQGNQIIEMNVIAGRDHRINNNNCTGERP